MNKKHYLPLPDNVTIRGSSVHGLGLFATKHISADHNFGITHVADARFEDGHIRLPLGGFFNHSDTPSCKVVNEGEFRYLVSLRKIEKGEEITALYTLYKP